jgi:hypothetical protein
MEKANPNEIFAERSEKLIAINWQRFVPPNSLRISQFDRVRTSVLVVAYNKQFPLNTVSAETLRKWRNGSLPRDGNLERWAEFLNTTVDYLCPGRSAAQLGKKKAPLELNSPVALDYLRNEKVFNNLDPEAKKAVSYILKYLPKRKSPA